ncbi:MAG: MATE family efflux transporter [Aeriscardovia sp.]|nr:MATE family efflux transporter [Aeriscardovia sp.]
MQDKKYIEMTQAPLGKLITKMAIPSVVSNVVGISYSLVDAFYVGSMGAQASAAEGVCMPVIIVIQAFGLLLGIGAGNRVSVELGKKNIKKAERLISTALFGSIVLGIILGGLGLALQTPLIHILGSTPAVDPLALQYVRPLLWIAPLFCATYVLNPAMRFQGYPTESMIAMIAGVVVNAAIEPVFMFVMRLGVFGAGVATAIAQAISFVIMLWIYIKKATAKLSIKLVSFERTMWKEIFSVGFPSFIRNGLFAVSSDLLNVVSAGYGAVAISAMTIVGRIINFGNVIQIGIGQGYQPVCGYNYGAKKYQRVLKGYNLILLASFILLAFICILEFIFAPQIVGVFIDNSKVVSYGALALRLQCLDFWLNAYVVMSNMMQQNLGYTVIASIVGLGNNCIFFIPLLLILPRFFHFLGIALTQPAAMLCTALMTFPLQMYVLRRLKKKQKKEEDKGAPKGA